MPKVFSRQTFGKFEDASASIPLRQLDRVFEGAGLRLGADPGGAGGHRRTQFRRYIAEVDQHQPQQLDQLGQALGALIAEVAVSKQDFLVTAAERDGFCFADGVFRPAATAPSFFAVTRVEDFAYIDDRGRRLHLIANDRPNDAVDGAAELVESVCRTVLRLIEEPAPPKTANFSDIATATLDALELVPVDIADAKGGAIVRRCLEQLSSVVVRLGELRNVYRSSQKREGGGESKSLSPRHARLAVGAAISFAGFVAETYMVRAEPKNPVTVSKTVDAAGP